MKIQKILLKHISIINEHSSPTILYFVSYGWGTLLDFIDFEPTANKIFNMSEKDEVTVAEYLSNKNVEEEIKKQ